MDTLHFISGLAVALVSSGALFLSGCAAESADAEADESAVAAGADESVGEAAQAIGSECAAAAATASFVSAINYTSPQTYNPPYCYKGVMLDVSSYASTAPLGYWIYTNVGWADSVPLASQSGHETACAQLWMQADLFERVNGTWVYKLSREDFGYWVADGLFSSDTCTPPTVNFNDIMVKGRTYRISATARTYKSSSAPTRKLNVVTSFVDPPR
jgi:hypothetical protein